MFKSRFSFVLAVVTCLALPFTGLAAPAGSQLPDTGSPTAFGVLGASVIGDAQLGAVAQPAQASVVYLVQQPAAAPAQSTGGSVLLGVLGAIPGEVWGALLGVAFTLIFSFWRGSSADKTRNVLLGLAEGAWYIAERNGGTGAQKFSDACSAFYKALTGSGLKLDSKTIAVRDHVFESMSAADKVAREKALEAEIRAKAAAQAAAETRPATATASELLAEAARA